MLAALTVLLRTIRLLSATDREALLVSAAEDSDCLGRGDAERGGALEVGVEVIVVEGGGRRVGGGCCC